MNQTARIGASVLLGVMLVVGAAWADALTVSGTVTDDGTGNPIGGAAVSVSIGMGMDVQIVYDTTGADGTYEINTTAGGGGAGGARAIVAVSADGYLSQTSDPHMFNPNDGRPDAIVQDFALVAGEDPVGDSLYVSGTVTASASGDPIPGATVTVRLVAGLGDEQTATATTDDDGNYAIAMVNENSAIFGGVAVSADGYATAERQLNIHNPDDGNADRYTRDFALDVASYDSLVVIGRVLDSATSEPLQNAWAVVSYRMGGIAGETVTDSVQTGSDGRFSLLMEVQTMPMGVQWTIRLAGYTEQSGNQTVANNDTADIGTVDLAETPTSGHDFISQARLPVTRLGGVAVYSLDGRLLFSATDVTGAATVRRLHELKTSGQTFVVRRMSDEAVRSEILVPAR
jgi:5-hydroxyisourate hydrolase-like protein (transthyretin family)